MALSKNYVIDGSGLSNIARFINHNKKPNVIAIYHPGKVTFEYQCTNHIHANQEVFVNYGFDTFDH